MKSLRKEIYSRGVGTGSRSAKIPAFPHLIPFGLLKSPLWVGNKSRADNPIKMCWWSILFRGKFSWDKMVHYW